jgi:type I restriction enzyme M protein
LFSNDSDALGDAYEYLIGQFAAGGGKKAGEFYTPQQVSTILSRIVSFDSQDPSMGKKKKLGSVFDFACGSPVFQNLDLSLKKAHQMPSKKICFQCS